jgi:hypothetical protein
LKNSTAILFPKDLLATVSPQVIEKNGIGIEEGMKGKNTGKLQMGKLRGREKGRG